MSHRPPILPVALAVALVAGLGWACPLVSQGTQDWTDRPDARAPAGVNEDALLSNDVRANDVDVDGRGLVYIVDRYTGFDILEFNRP